MTAAAKTADTTLAAAEAEAALAAAKVRRLSAAARAEAERARFAEAGALGLKDLVDRRHELTAWHDSLIRTEWRAFRDLAESGDWSAVRDGYLAWADARIEAAVTMEAATKARATLANAGLLSHDGSTGRYGWANRYPPITFSAALDTAFSEIAPLDWDTIAEHPRFVDPSPPPSAADPVTP